MGPKVIYLAERNPALPREAWNARWREHGELARSLPIWRHIWRYEQNRTIAVPDNIAACVPGACGDAYGGVGETWYRSTRARQAMRNEPSLAEIQPDEVETFGRAVAEFAVLTSEQVRYEASDTGVKFVIFIFEAKEPQKQFWSSWRAFIASPPLVPLMQAASAYIEGPAINPSPSASPSREGSDKCAGVIEIGFRDRASLAEATSRPAVSTAWQLIAERLGDARVKTILVEQTLLYDELEEIDWAPTELHALRLQMRSDPR
ncbi:MAG TPA: EthD domain-containing protein [Solirubrobacteraceae bacterium]|jgi:hypothetical protein|nr:EthD domain-containing protein [Solirubrobacteraceae bacterium]